MGLLERTPSQQMTVAASGLTLPETARQVVVGRALQHTAGLPPTAKDWPAEHD